jgi:hypothetical protein
MVAAAAAEAVAAARPLLRQCRLWADFFSRRRHSRPAAARSEFTAPPHSSAPCPALLGWDNNQRQRRRRRRCRRRRCPWRGPASLPQPQQRRAPTTDHCRGSGSATTPSPLCQGQRDSHRRRGARNPPRRFVRVGGRRGRRARMCVGSCPHAHACGRRRSPRAAAGRALLPAARAAVAGALRC